MAAAPSFFDESYQVWHNVPGPPKDPFLGVKDIDLAQTVYLSFVGTNTLGNEEYEKVTNSGGNAVEVARAWRNSPGTPDEHLVLRIQGEDERTLLANTPRNRIFRKHVQQVDSLVNRDDFVMLLAEIVLFSLIGPMLVDASAVVFGVKWLGYVFTASVGAWLAAAYVHRSDAFSGRWLLALASIGTVLAATFLGGVVRHWPPNVWPFS